jgi:RNA polymerase sigma factor (TIGR02999 family)
MRSILVDHARGKAATKRGGELRRVPFEGAAELGASQDLDVLDLEEHMQLLGSLNERQARIAECRLFAGMTIREVAEALGVSPRTVDDDWAMARAWLSARLGGAA